MTIKASGRASFVPHTARDSGHCREQRSQKPAGLMALSLAPQGQRVCVTEITANQRVKQRLATLGISRGVDLAVMQDNGNALLVAVRGTRLALERKIAHQIRVQPAQEV